MSRPTTVGTEAPAELLDCDWPREHPFLAGHPARWSLVGKPVHQHAELPELVKAALQLLDEGAPQLRDG
ncbi:hypothetical protein [Sorangium sp. So ce1099]|uniref:hypothetical protein n=1 Tax=Sorangium sp. So ce1099 TaxID=3133331 RepID=UPI003F633794